MCENIESISNFEGWGLVAYKKMSVNKICINRLPLNSFLMLCFQTSYARFLLQLFQRTMEYNDVLWSGIWKTPVRS